MESSAADAGRVAPPPRRWVVDRRLMGVAVVTEVTAVFLAYMVVNVPVLGPLLTREEASQHWREAVIAGLVVAAGSLFVVRTALRRRASEPEAVGRVAPPAVSAPAPPAVSAPAPPAVSAPAPPAVSALAQADVPRIPRSLQLERVPGTWVRLAAAWTLAAAAVSFVLGAPLWLAWLTILSPWLAFVAIEGKIRYARDAVFACFGLLVVLQLLHMVEHSTQVGQLLATGGSFARSHGAIGQLDFETVHFVTDTTLWISLGLLAIIFRARNAWLWVAFAAASMHQIEHFYLFWLYAAEHTVYLSGGAAGIMGDHGLIGTPLDRPYLHYTYNFIVFVPMLIAFWDEARRQDRLHPASRAA